MSSFQTKNHPFLQKLDRPCYFYPYVDYNKADRTTVTESIFDFMH